MKYYCEYCDRDVDDQGPYETSDGEYCCQDCMEGAQARADFFLVTYYPFVYTFVSFQA